MYLNCWDLGSCKYMACVISIIHSIPYHSHAHRLLSFTDGVSDQSSGLRKHVIVDKERGISQHNASVIGYHVVEHFDPPLPATPSILQIKQTISYRVIYPIQVSAHVCMFECYNVVTSIAILCFRNINHHHHHHHHHHYTYLPSSSHQLCVS